MLTRTLSRSGPNAYLTLSLIQTQTLTLSLTQTLTMTLTQTLALTLTMAFTAA